MVVSPVPKDESARLASLRSYDILDTLPEQDYNRIVAVASALCDTPIALFTLVDAKRQWFKARIGLDAQETSRVVSFCAHAVASNEELLVDDAMRDPRFVDNALVINSPHIRFYFGVPVHANDGQPLGTLCVIDKIPRKLTENQRAMLRELALEVEALLELRHTIKQLQERQEDRAVMSSMIAHDARNLMTRIVGKLDLLRTRVLGENADMLAQVHSYADQLLRMCNNFVALNKGTDQPALDPQLVSTDLPAWFESLVQRESHRVRGESLELVAHAKLKTPIRRTDPALLERIVLNLLDNAYRESPVKGKVHIALLEGKNGAFELIVEDKGKGISENARDRLFEPFFSVRDQNSRGSGLGLAFCRLAAQALGGSIVYESPAEGGTRFRVDLPDPPMQSD